MRSTIITALLAALLQATSASAGTEFVYQGQLQDNGQAYTGNANLVFELFDAQSAGTELAEVSRSVTVTDGLFQASLDFGAQPYASGLWLQITVNGTMLDQRQLIHAAPWP